MNRILALAFAIGLASQGIVSSQSIGNFPSAWAVSVAPVLTVPLTAADFSANDLFALAWGAALGAEYGLGLSIPLSLKLDASYSIGTFLPAAGIEVPGTLGEAALMAGVVYGLPLSPALTLRGFAGGGLSWGSLSSGTSSIFGTVRLGGGIDLDFTRELTGRLEASGMYKLGLYSAVGVSLGLGYKLPVAASRQPATIRLLELSSLKLENVFPIFRSFYDDNPVGTATIVNTGKDAARDIRVSFVIRQYMDAPKECATIKLLEPGQSVEVKLYALFNDKILAVTEATKVSAEVSLEYSGDGAEARTATVLVYDRNALTWDDDRKAAAFVSSKDPWVLDLSGNIVAAVKSVRNSELPKNIQTAIAIHEGLRSFGLAYVLSPNRPFAQAVVNPEVVDSLKFPRQTLSWRSGDCADLSVLYASCFEAVGIETAFITVPGHIFMAFDSGLSPDDLKLRSLDEREFIVLGGKVWLPVETTMRDSGFLDVWKKAAGTWRDSSTRKNAILYPVHDAWKIYAPVGLPADGTSVTVPAQAILARAFQGELAKAVDAELSARLAGLAKLQQAGKESPKFLNDRGVLYGKYGKLNEAERDFQTAAKADYLPAIINLGNVAYLKADMAGALAAYQKAAGLSPNNAKLLVNLAKAAAALGKTDLVTSTLAAVHKIDPGVAEQYASLITTSSSAGTRAAAQDEGGLLWF